MSLWILICLIIHRCHGLGTPSIKFKNDVGEISLLQPTFAGRNVSFTFTPSTPTALGDIEWKYMNGSVEHTIERENDQFIVRNDDVSSFFTILYADQSLNGIFVFTSNDDNNRSKLIGLYLKDYTDAKGCGELYLLSEEPVFAGDNVSFGYFPSPEVAKEKNASKNVVELVKGNNEDHMSILPAHGVSELHKVGNEYILTLLNVKKSTSGHYYRIRCAEGVTEKYSNSINLTVKGMPVIGPLTTISACRECILFETKDTLEMVYCETDGENTDTNVAFTIGFNEFPSIGLSGDRFMLHSKVQPSEAMHRLNAVCTVSGMYRNTSVEAQIYVVAIPDDPPYLSASQVLLEGESVNITCISAPARPPPHLKLFVGESAIDTNLSTAFDNKTGLNKSISNLHSFKREWGNKKMWCLQLSGDKQLFYTTFRSNETYVEYKYPPLNLLLNLDVIDQGNQSKAIAVRCTALDSNPVCNITWESSIENFKYTLDQYVTQKHISMSTISLNVTDADFGKEIRCRTKCQDFFNTVSNSTTVIFAKKPRVVISSSSVLPVPPTSHLALTCASNAFPDGNITWKVLKAFNSDSSHEKSCLYASTCTYEMTTSDVEQEYLCITENEHGTDRGSITVTVRKNEHNEELTGKDSSSLVVEVCSIVAVIAIICLGLVVLCFYRRQKQAKLTFGDNQTEMAQLPSPTAADNNEVTHAHKDGAEYAEIHRTQRDPENVALITFDEDMLACKAKNECLGNAATGRSVHVEQQLIDIDDSALEQTQSTQHDARTAADRDDVTHTHMDATEYAVIDKTHRDPKLVALPFSKDILSCKGDNERLDNAATESSVNLEQPSLANGIRALEPGPLRQPNVSGCHSKEDINTTEKVKDIVVSKQKQITNPDAPNANIPKRATDELVYADVDIEYLEKSRSGNRARNNDKPTEYSDIVFGASCSVQTDSSKEAVYNN